MVTPWFSLFTWGMRVCVSHTKQLLRKTALVVAVLTQPATPSYAAALRLTGQASANLPVKRSSDEPGIAFGPEVVSYYQLSPMFHPYLRLGFLAGLPKDLFGTRTRTLALPVSLGMRAHWHTQKFGFFSDFDVGTNTMWTSVTDKFGIIDDKTITRNGFGVRFGSGYRLDAWTVAVYVTLYDITVNDFGNYSGLVISLARTLAALELTSE